MAIVATYCLISPFATKETVNILKTAFERAGSVKEANETRGYLSVRLHYYKIEVFVEHAEKNCKVRAICHSCANDKWWDEFLEELFKMLPGVDFGVTLSHGTPYVMSVLYLDEELQEIFYSKTSQHTSMFGLLSNGFLLGDSSGNSRTTAGTYMKFSDRRLARLLYNNGRLWEGYIKKNSKLYHEVMVNI